MFPDIPSPSFCRLGCLKVALTVDVHHSGQATVIHLGTETNVRSGQGQQETWNNMGLFTLW